MKNIIIKNEEVTVFNEEEVLFIAFSTQDSTDKVGFNTKEAAEAYAKNESTNSQIDWMVWGVDDFKESFGKNR